MFPYGITTRQRRQRSPSFSSLEDDKPNDGRPSVKSRNSTKASIRSPRKSMASSGGGSQTRPDAKSKRFKGREYLLLLIEASLSLSVFVIRQRNLSPDETLRLGLSSRTADIYMHYAEGHSSWVSLIVGCLADSYFTHYTMALFSVIFHFAAVCIVFMEDTVKRSQTYNPYAEPVRNACILMMVLIRSTDFTRLVYGLEGMSDRRATTINMFIFFHFFVSTYATYGGIIVNVLGTLFLFLRTNMVIVAFVLSGLSLFIFVYILHPDTDWKEQKGLGCKVVGCLLLATYYKIFRIRKRGRRGFLANTEGTYSKNTITRTKEILLFYLLFLPAFAIALLIMVRGNVFFDTIVRAIEVDTRFPTLALGLRQFSRSILSIAMLLSYFVISPLLHLAGMSKRNTTKFLIGHLFAVFAYLYAAILTRVSEPLQYPPGSGLVRVFNTRDQPVYFTPEDLDFTTHSFGVDPKSGLMAAYPCDQDTLFTMNVRFNGTVSNYTTFLAVTPQRTIGYMVLDPPEIVRIRGPYLPLREGPAGTNEQGWARMYIYNAAKTLDGVSVKIKYAHTKKTLQKVVLHPGKMTTLQLKPALYDFSINQADIKELVKLEGGAVYGMMIFSTLSTREMVIDTVLHPLKQSVLPLLGLTFVIGLGYGFCYPALRAMVYTVSPPGLMGMSFAFLSFLEGMALWFMYIGCVTWHPFITGNVLFAYAAGTGIFLFLCMFVFVKNKERYS